jgi:hypothetical protein
MDLKKSLTFYQKAMEGKDPYGTYRFALSLISGKLSK